MPPSPQAETLIQDFSVQHDLPHGRLTIRPVHADDVGAAAVLLTRAFAGSAQGVPLSDGRQYCLDSLQQPPRGVLLVARLHPEGAWGGMAGARTQSRPGLYVPAAGLPCC